MIKHILFDMGQVLIRFDPQYFIRKLGIQGDDALLLIREVFRSVQWVQMDRGTLCEETAFKIIASRLPPRLHDAAWKLMCMWDRPILEVEGMYDLVAELKEKGYGLYLLSNASVRQHDYWPRIPASRFFDGTLISADVKVIKPQPEIYRLCLEKFGLKAEECFFIDDSPANIEGAANCGIAGAVFHGDTALLRSQLREAGIDVTN